MKPHNLENYSYNHNKFKVNGKSYKVVGSDTTGYKSIYSRDRLRDLETNEVVEVSREKLFAALEKNKAEIIL